MELSTSDVAAHLAVYKMQHVYAGYDASGDWLPNAPVEPASQRELGAWQPPEGDVPAHADVRLSTGQVFRLSVTELTGAELDRVRPLLG